MPRLREREREFLFVFETFLFFLVEAHRERETSERAFERTREQPCDGSDARAIVSKKVL